MSEIPTLVVHLLRFRQFLAHTEQCTRWRPNDAIRVFFRDLFPSSCRVLSNAKVPAVGEIKAATRAKSILSRNSRHTDGRIDLSDVGAPNGRVYNSLFVSRMSMPPGSAS